MSSFPCHLSPVTCLPLPTFYSTLIKTVFRLKSLEDRKKKTFDDEAVEGLVIDRVRKDFSLCGEGGGLVKDKAIITFQFHFVN